MPFCTKCGGKLEDGDVFCGVCGAAAPLASISVDEADDAGAEAEAQEPEPRREAEEVDPVSEEGPESIPEPSPRESQIKHCPACGEIVGLNDFVCGACGHELRRVTDGSINELYCRLEALEAGRSNDESKNADGVSRTDALKANAIRYFPIPNTKQDLLEFLVMAKANSQEGDKEYEEVVLDAWKSKFDQAYDKAEALFGEDEDFSKFEKIRGRIHRSRPLRLDKDNMTYLILFSSLIIMMCLLIFWGWTMSLYS